jgi:hypothetical protein
MRKEQYCHRISVLGCDPYLPLPLPYGERKGAGGNVRDSFTNVEVLLVRSWNRVGYNLSILV